MLRCRDETGAGAGGGGGDDTQMGKCEGNNSSLGGDSLKYRSVLLVHRKKNLAQNKEKTLLVKCSLATGHWPKNTAEVNCFQHRQSLFI